MKQEHSKLYNEVKLLLIDVNEMTPSQAVYKLRNTDDATLKAWKKELTSRMNQRHNAWEKYETEAIDNQ